MSTERCRARFPAGANFTGGQVLLVDSTPGGRGARVIGMIADRDHVLDARPLWTKGRPALPPPLRSASVELALDAADAAALRDLWAPRQVVRRRGRRHVWRHPLLRRRITITPRTP